ncbi:MAG: hypothetical protein J6N81_05770 [Treponema sp.]|nr:hypothetical protein [Treponema sp.]
MKEEFIILDESCLLQAAQLFKSAFAGEPWHDDWSSQEMLLEYIKEVSGGYNALNFGLLVDGKLAAISLAESATGGKARTTILRSFACRLTRRERGSAHGFCR